MRRRRLRDEQRAEHVDVEGTAVELGGGGLERARRVDAGDVDDRPRRPELLDRALDGRADRLRVGDVDGERERAVELRLHAVERRDLPALGEEALGARAAHPARGARDDRDAHPRTARVLEGGGPRLTPGRAAQDPVDALVGAVHVALPQMARDVDPRLGPRAAPEPLRQPRLAALVRAQELGDEPGLGRVDRQLRAARGGETDEEQALQARRQRHPGDPQRDALRPLDRHAAEERERRLEAGRVDDRVERAGRAVGEVHVVAVEALDRRRDADAAVVDEVQQLAVDDRAVAVQVARGRGRQARSARACRARRRSARGSPAPARAPAAA